MRPILALTLLTLLAPLPAMDWYVAPPPRGQDGQAGSAQAPFASIQAAANQATAGDTVYVTAGTYRESVRPAASGTAAEPIRYVAQGEVIIDGREPISSWTKRNGNWVASMPADFFSQATPGDGSNLYDATVQNQADQIFWNHDMLPVARWPNDADYDPSLPTKAVCDAFISRTRNADNWTESVMQDADFKLGTSVVGSEIMLQPNNGGWSWITSGFISKVDGDQFTIRTRSTAGEQTFNADRYHKHSRYIIFNHPDLLDTPGEWYHDKSAGELILRSPDDSNPVGRVSAKKRLYGFDCSDRSYIQIEGFRLIACSITTDRTVGGDNIGFTADGGVRYPWRNPSWKLPKDPYHQIDAYKDAPSRHMTLLNLRIDYPTHFTDVSGHFANQWGMSSGVVLSGRFHLIKNCHIRYSAGNGISLFGRNHRAISNVVEDTNYAAVGCAAIDCGHIARGSSDMLIAYNTVSRTGRSALNLNYYRSDPEDPQSPARVHHNDVSGWGMQDWDVGGTYSGPDHRFVRIDHNVFHDAWPNVDNIPGIGAFTTSGVYPDYGSNLIIDHNLIVDTEWGIHIQNQNNKDGNANFLILHNTISVRGFSDPLPGYGPFAIVTNSGASQAGTVVRGNLAWCSNNSPRFRFIDFDNDPSKNRLVDHNLWWDGIDGSDTDPKLLSGSDRPQGFMPSTDSSLLIEGGTVYEIFNRDGWNVPVPMGTIQGDQPDIGAFEANTPPWFAGHRAIRTLSMQVIDGFRWESQMPSDRAMSDIFNQQQILAIGQDEDAEIAPVGDGDS